MSQLIFGGAAELYQTGYGGVLGGPGISSAAWQFRLGGDGPPRLAL
jgi:hypothetical protein